MMISDYLADAQKLIRLSSPHIKASMTPEKLFKAHFYFRLKSKSFKCAWIGINAGAKEVMLEVKAKSAFERAGLHKSAQLYNLNVGGFHMTAPPFP